ncbi:MAG: DUF4924 family protein [Muribaculaceae bacterium]|nr:DUF4924 family protein [Muribaculaceae bacterium]
MLIASQKRKENIAEYLLYMWQVEDIIRAFNLDIERIKRNVIDPIPDVDDETRHRIAEWYESLIDMMRREEVEKSGHLQMNRNTIGDLADLSRRLIADGRYEDYTRAYYDALPVIVELRSKSGDHPAGEVETCFNSLYAMLLLRMQKQDISPATQQAMTKITRLIGLLAAYYKKDEAGELFGKDDETEEAE